MEINLLTLCFFISFVTLVLQLWAKPKTGKLPPGPWKLPIIGNMHHLAGATLPHVALRDLSKKYGDKDLMHLKLGQVSVVVVSSAVAAKEFLKTHDLNFAERPKILSGEVIFYGRTDLVLCPYGDYWKQMRKVCIMELLSPKMVRTFSSIRNDEIHRLLNRVRSSSGSPINISDEITLFTSSILCRAAYGKTLTGTKEFLKVADEISLMTGGFCIADMFPSWKIIPLLTGEKSRMLKLHNKADVILSNIIKEHENNLESGKAGNGESGTEDLVDVFLRLKNSKIPPMSISDDHIKSVILDIFGGGTDTSAMTATCALVEMVRNPRVLVKAQAEVRQFFKGKDMLDENDMEQLKYLNLVIKETMRLHPTGAMLSRECKKETVVCGYTITPKTRVLVNFWAISRDPKYWEEPEKFIPERFENSSMDFIGTQLEFIPFGAGRRICPGISFGLANVQFPLAHLLNHFDWKAQNELEITMKPGLVVKVNNDLLLSATPAA